MLSRTPCEGRPSNWCVFQQSLNRLAIMFDKFMESWLMMWQWRWCDKNNNFLFGAETFRPENGCKKTHDATIFVQFVLYSCEVLYYPWLLARNARFCVSCTSHYYNPMIESRIIYSCRFNLTGAGYMMYIAQNDKIYYV
jgi:hypothetical protein